MQNVSPHAATAAIAIITGIAGSGVAMDVPTEWTYELQIRSDPVAGFNIPAFAGLSSQPVSLDDDGSVAIRAIVPGGEAIIHAVNGVGGPIKTVFSVDPVWSSSISHRNNRIALDEFFGDVEIIDDAGNTERIYSPGGPEGISGFQSVTLLSDGAIGYRGEFGFFDKHVIDEFDGPTRLQTAFADDFSGQYTFLATPNANDARQMSGRVFFDPAGQGVVRWEDGLPPLTIASDSDGFNGFVNGTAMASNGDVAFSARRASDSIWQVTRWSPDGLTVIAEGSNPDLDNGSFANFGPKINASGWVVFRVTSGISTGLFIGDGENLVDLVTAGQVFETDIGPLRAGFDFGPGTGVQTMNSSPAINDAGQVAFSVFLENGTIGVFVATPVSGCPADFNGDGLTDFFDVQAFLNAFDTNMPAADINGDGLFDFFDVQGFLNVFQAGCP